MTVEEVQKKVEQEQAEKLKKKKPTLEEELKIMQKDQERNLAAHKKFIEDQSGPKHKNTHPEKLESEKE
jgi:hypothetical protein